MSTSEPEYDPNQCTACRGTGTLISGLGGTPHDVRCPWCEGTGTRIPGMDAQAHPAEDGPAAAAAAAPADEEAPADDGADSTDAT
jgi:hypothetical protein